MKMNTYKLVTLCVICAAMAMSGCIGPDGKGEFPIALETGPDVIFLNEDGTISMTDDGITTTYPGGSWEFDDENDMYLVSFDEDFMIPVVLEDDGTFSIEGDESGTWSRGNGSPDGGSDSITDKIVDKVADKVADKIVEEIVEPTTSPTYTNTAQFVKEPAEPLPTRSREYGVRTIHWHTGTQSSRPAPVPDHERVYVQMGDLATMDNMIIRLFSVKTSTTYPIDFGHDGKKTARPGYKFVIVDVYMKNTGRHLGDYGSCRFVAIDSANYEYESGYGYQAEDGIEYVFHMQPGQDTRGTVIFHVKESVTLMSIQYNVWDNERPNESASWYIKGGI